jgi:spermidine synthase
LSTTLDALPEQTATSNGHGVDNTVEHSRLKRWTPRGVVGFTMLFTGISSFVQELLISIVFTYILGNSIEQFTVTMAVMLGMMAVGGFFQRVIKDKSIGQVFIINELLLVVIGGFAPIALLWAYVSLPNSFEIIKFLYMAVPGFLIGMEIPLMARINEKWSRDLKTNLSQTIPWDYIGGAIGGVAFIWLLKQYVPLTTLSFIIAGCNLAVAIVCLSFLWKRGMLKARSRGFALTFATLTVVLAVFVGSMNATVWSRSAGQHLYDDPIAAQLTTRYQNIVLTRGNHPRDPFGYAYTMWLNGNKQFNSGDEAIYHENLVHPAMNLAARRDRVLILGGGDGMALREVLKYDDVQEVTLADLDPQMIEFASENPTMRELNQDAFRDARVTSSLDDSGLNAGITDGGEREVLVETDQTERVACDDQGECVPTPVTESVAAVTVHTVDADRFVSAHAGEYWDVVIVDLPDPNSVELAKLYSVEFYGRVKDIVSPDGIVVVQSASPEHAPESFLCIMRTMAAAGLNVVPYHDNVPSFGDWGWNLGSPSLSHDELLDRAVNLDDYGVDTERESSRSLQANLVFDEGVLESERDTFSTLMDPVIYQYYVGEGWRID